MLFSLLFPESIVISANMVPSPKMKSKQQLAVLLEYAAAYNTQFVQLHMSTKGVQFANTVIFNSPCKISGSGHRRLYLDRRLGRHLLRLLLQHHHDLCAHPDARCRGGDIVGQRRERDHSLISLLLWRLQVFYNPYDNPENPFGDAASVYDFISCWKAPQGNKEDSYLTFFSSGKYSAWVC